MTDDRSSKPVLSDDIEYDKSGVVRVKPEAMLRRVKEYIAAHKEDDTKAPASNSSAAVLRSWSGVVVDRNLSSDLAIAADEIERLEFQVYALTNANKSLLDRAAGQPPNRHTDEPSAAPDYTAVYDAFGIGSAVRNPRTLLTNVENVLRRSRCLDAIEREFFMRIEKDEDGEEYEDCPLSWGSDPAGYIEQFREALAARAAEPSAARRAEYWKAEHLAGNAAIERLQQRVHELERELTAVRSSHDSLVAQRAAEPPSAWREGRPPNDAGSYLVACATGQVAPYIRGIILNNVGTPWDWNYGEAISHWMPLPGAPVTKSAIGRSLEDQIAQDLAAYGKHTVETSASLNKGE